MDTRVPVFVINLDRRPDRLESISAHLDAHGLDFTRWPAVDGALPGNPIIAASVTPAGHAAAMESHREVWQAIADGPDEVGLILEDDAMLDDRQDWPTLLLQASEAMRSANMGILQLGFLSYGWQPRLAYGVSDWLTARARRLDRPGRTEGGSMRLTDSLEVVIGDYRMGTHCYLVQRQAARRLQGLNRPAFRQCDVLLADVARLDPARLGWLVARSKESIAGQASERKGRLGDSDTT